MNNINENNALSLETAEVLEAILAEQQIIERWEVEHLEELTNREVWSNEREDAWLHTDVDALEESFDKEVKFYENSSFADLTFHLEMFSTKGEASSVDTYLTEIAIKEELKKRVKKNPLNALRFPIEALF